MRIEQITVKNYKVFRDMTVKDLGNFCVFLGANGSGKSTFFDIFGFLSDALRQNIRIAIDKRGGFKEVISRGADPMKDEIEIEIKFRNSPQEQVGEKSPLITYGIKIGLENGKPIVNREVLKYRRGQRGARWHFLDFKKGEGYAITNEEQYGQEGIEETREFQALESKDILAIKGLGQFQKFRAITAFRKLLDNWFVSNFNITASRSTQDIGVSEHLSTSGENISQVTRYLYQNHRDIFDQILEKMKQRIPGVNNVQATETEDGRIVLKFQDEGFKDPFIARYVSDGTLKMFAYLVLLHEPEAHPLLCIEEPENYLHPELLGELAEEFREYADKGGQVFISTHSPDFVNALDISELFWITKKNGYSCIISAGEQEDVKKLFEAGDRLGSLWSEKYLIGSGPQS